MDKKPTMADLRESGALEQDADVVLLLHADEDQPGSVLAAVAKNRHGTTGAFELDRYGRYARITDQRWTPSRTVREERAS
jgi:replicative DNA helicase